jgi:hypothetical protein
MAGKLTPALAEKERRVVELRTAGVEFEDIARDVGFMNRGSAYLCFQRALKRIPAQAVEEYRETNRLRLELLWRAIFNKASAGQLFAVDRALAILKQESELLGLDAPTRIDMTVVAQQTAERVAAETGVSYEEALSEVQSVLAAARR